MNILTSIATSLFATPKSIEKTIDTLAAAGDKIWYTDEEKADYKVKMADWTLKLYESMAPFNVAMRALALIVAATWVGMLSVSALFELLGIFICDTPKLCAATNAAAAIDIKMDKYVIENFNLIMTFYFAAAGLNGAIRTYQNGKTSKKG